MCQQLWPSLALCQILCPYTSHSYSKTLAYGKKPVFWSKYLWYAWALVYQELYTIFFFQIMITPLWHWFGRRQGLKMIWNLERNKYDHSCWRMVKIKRILKISLVAVLFKKNKNRKYAQHKYLTNEHSAIPPMIANLLLPT